MVGAIEATTEVVSPLADRKFCGAPPPAGNAILRAGRPRNLWCGIGFRRGDTADSKGVQADVDLDAHEAGRVLLTFDGIAC